VRNYFKTNLGIIYIALCIILWSLIPTVAKLAQNGLDHHQYLFYSSIVSFLSIFVVSLFQGKLKEILTYSKKVMIVLFVLGFLDFLYYLLLYFGYKHANGLEVLVIQYMWPIFIVFLSLIILKEDLTIKKLLSVVLGFIGVSLVITKGDYASLDFSQIDVLLIVMIGAIAFALFSVLSKVVKVDATNAVMIYFFSAVLYSIITVSSYSTFIIPSGKDWISILINGAFINGISYLFWIKGLQIFDTSKIAPYLFITPILAAFFLILFFDEPILTIYLVGLFFVIFSGLINSIKSKS
jgi:drug/metabolite transporter (DMT)-like permease|tara:strand:+ start:22299 stop:23183 length:885 start_codon:yes stop_codon:yes gene_type:complete